ncbi:ComF family protein [Leucobacter sp. Z1108]|uniref:ComF family protein n=1 Tax=Leucobacter sp. Z1108 TaxID=3439066 RepID=UPI003F38FEEF
MTGRGDELLGRVIHWLREVLLDALALLWPTQCVNCGAPDRDCCDGCRNELRAGNGTAVWVATPVGVPACVAGPYEGPLRAQLVAFKHAGHTGFARELGARLNAPLRVAISLARAPTMPLLVTVPSRAARVRQRGYRHVDMLVRAALRCGTSAPVTPAAYSPASGSPGISFAPHSPGMQRTPRTAPRPWLLPRALSARPGRTSQVGLTATQRQRNAALVEVTPAARTILHGREVVLIDDVVTTGATVVAAHRALTEAGARVIAIVALCAVERRSDRQDDQAAPHQSNGERSSSNPVTHLPIFEPKHNRVENER